MKKRPQRLVFIDEIADHGQEKRIGQMLIGLMSQRNDNTDRFGAPQPQISSAYIGIKMGIIYVCDPSRLASVRG